MKEPKKTPSTEEMIKEIREAFESGELVMPEEVPDVAEVTGLSIDPRERPGMVQVMIYPETLVDARLIFDILSENGVGCAWMGESGFFIIQAFDAELFSAWMGDWLAATVSGGEKVINARLEIGDPFEPGKL